MLQDALLSCITLKLTHGSEGYGTDAMHLTSAPLSVITPAVRPVVGSCHFKTLREDRARAISRGLQTLQMVIQ